MNDYETLSKNYEALNPKEEIFKQKSFFEEIVKTYSIESCLDCACGAGWHLAMLNRLGVSCFGSDLSGDMLSMASENLKELGIPLKKEDYRHLSQTWDRKFDMVICMSTSLNHMLSDDDYMAALDSMYRQLNNNGILIIDNGISDSLINGKPRLIPARLHRDQAFYFFLEYPDEQRIIFNILNVRHTGETFEHDFDSTTLRALKQEHLDLYLINAGFRDIRYYGDIEFTEYSREKSNRLIVVAKKKDFTI
jgi:glycine/sarcosine N-methyltransferase